MDKRFIRQVVVIGCLVVLPIATIAFNGVRALSMILTLDPASEPTSATIAPVRTESQASSYSTKRPPLEFGVYDPGNAFAGERLFGIRHIYISWINFEPQVLAQQLKDLRATGATPLLTIEPWPHTEEASGLLVGIVKGEYDQAIDNVVGAFGNDREPLSISWGHEMDQDLTADRYPWSGRDPQQFIAAYRYVVDRIRQKSNAKLTWVWTGVIKQGSLNYYPGDDYVDAVGMPVYSFPHWDQKIHGHIRKFSETFEQKRDIVRSLNKPLMITELGVSGSPDFSVFWLRDAFISLDNYPELTSVIFFHSRDSEGAWGKDINTPDWRIHPDAIRSLVKWKLSAQGL